MSIVRTKSKAASRAPESEVIEAVPPEPSSEAAPSLAVHEAPEKQNAPAFEPGSDTSVSYPRLVHWYTSGSDGGRRSFLSTARHFGVDESTLREQARRGRWLERAAAFDRAQLARELDTSLAVQRRAVIAQVSLAERLTGVIERVVTELEGADDENALDMLEPALSAAKALARVQASLRTAVGLPTNSTRIDVKVDVKTGPDTSQFDGMSDEEIALMDALEQAKLKRLGRGHG